MNAHTKAENVVIAAMLVVAALAVLYECASTNQWLGAIAGLMAQPSGQRRSLRS